MVFVFQAHSRGNVWSKINEWKWENCSQNVYRKVRAGNGISTNHHIMYMSIECVPPDVIYKNDTFFAASTAGAACTIWGWALILSFGTHTRTHPKYIWSSFICGIAIIIIAPVNPLQLFGSAQCARNNYRFTEQYQSAQPVWMMFLFLIDMR